MWKGLIKLGRWGSNAFSKYYLKSRKRKKINIGVGGGFFGLGVYEGSREKL
ncbi:hypothetical protein [Thermoflavimicrobium daqui]|uniref:hypothetical protein n=1 Tax=Thermoflavimicrobium daqui TaxID=2137476 RepID=UPI00143DA67D|nr:hypothetical protein [Thermoflavimicrobium daqui]